MQPHGIAFLPLALNHEVAVLQLAFHFLAVHTHRVGQLASVGKGIKVARHHLSPYPTGNAEHEAEVAGLVLIDAQGDVAVPGIFGLLLDDHIMAVHLHGGCVAGEEVHIEVPAANSIEVAGQ